MCFYPRVWIYVLLGVGAEGKKRVLNYTYFIYAFNETCSWNLRRKWCEGFYEFKLHFVFYPLNITFWGLGQVVWINWIRTQSFVPGKKYFSPHMETTCTPPHQSSFSLKHSLPVAARSDLPRQDTASSAEPQHKSTYERSSAGVPTPLPSGTPKSFLFCTAPGDSLPRESSGTNPGWARDFQSQKRSMCFTKSLEKRNPSKGGPKSPTLLKNKAF